MGIYKVHIKTDSDSAMFTVNQTILIVIVKTGDKYELTDMDNCVHTYGSMDEAMEQAKQKITRFFGTLGIKPNFIND